MDGEGTAWTEGGCENGPKRFSRGRTLAPAEQRAVREAFAALPPTDGKDCDWSDRFRLRAADGTARVWYVCGREGDHPNPLEVEGLLPPYDAAARALRQGSLVRAP